MKKPPPAFQFYPADWLSSTKVSLMTPAEEGAYLRLLCHAWAQPDCSLPDDDEVLATLSRLGSEWTKGSGEKIRRCFVRKRKKLFNERLQIERQKQVEFREKCKQAGIASGKARKNNSFGLNDGSTDVEPKTNSLSPFPSSSSSALEGKKNKGISSRKSLPLSFKTYRKLKSIEPEVADSIQAFLDAYEHCMGKEHPPLRPEQWQFHVATFMHCESDDVDDFSVENHKAMIDKYFATDFGPKCDYRIHHYNTHGVKLRRFYEEAY